MSDQPETLTWRERLAAWWTAGKAALRKAWEWIKPDPENVLIACVVVLGVVAGVMLASVLWHRTAAEWAEQAHQINARITALEAAQAATPVAAVCDPVQVNAPAPARTRAPVSRVAPTPTEPAPPTAAWSQPTDLDRAIDRFSTNLQESTQ